MSRFKGAVKALEKRYTPGVKPTRVWIMRDGKRVPLGPASPIYDDPDASKYRDIDLQFVESDGNGRRKIGPDPDHPSVRPGQVA